MDPRFQHATYLLRKRVLKLAGAAFRIFDPEGRLVLYADQKAFKLKEDIRLFGEEEKTTELLRISARRAIDVSATYDVTDALTGEKVGILRRRGLKSMLRDEWDVLDPAEQPIGTVQEESMAAALIRRFIAGSLLPQTFHVTIGGTEAARFHQKFNPFIPQIELDFTSDPDGRLDRRLGLATAVLLAAIEGRQGG